MYLYIHPNQCANGVWTQPMWNGYLSCHITIKNESYESYAFKFCCSSPERGLHPKPKRPCRLRWKAWSPCAKVCTQSSSRLKDTTPSLALTTGYKDKYTLFSWRFPVWLLVPIHFTRKEFPSSPQLPVSGRGSHSFRHSSVPWTQLSQPVVSLRVMVRKSKGHRVAHLVSAVQGTFLGQNSTQLQLIVLVTGEWAIPGTKLQWRLAFLLTNNYCIQLIQRPLTIWAIHIDHAIKTETTWNHP